MKSAKSHVSLITMKEKQICLPLVLLPSPVCFSCLCLNCVSPNATTDEWKIFEIRNTKRIIGSRKNERRKDKKPTKKRKKYKKQNFKWDSDIHLEFWERDRCYASVVCVFVQGSIIIKAAVTKKNTKFGAEADEICARVSSFFILKSICSSEDNKNS